MYTIPNIPCTISIATALSVFGDPNALQNISVLLYSDDTVTVRFLLIVRLSTSSEPSWVNPLLITLRSDATVPLTLYDISSTFSAVQVNSTVVPSTAVIETGLTRKTIQKMDLLKKLMLKIIKDYLFKSMNTKNM